MNRSDIACCPCSSRTIFCFSTLRITLGVMAVALPIRIGCPARHPSPKKSPGPSMATTASRPDLDSTDSLTPPAWMYMTCSHASPCVKTVSARPYLRNVFATPTESRNACALKGAASPLRPRLFVRIFMNFARPYSRLEDFLVREPRLRGRGEDVVFFLLLPRDFALRRVALVQAQGLGLRLPRPGFQRDGRDDHSERLAVRRRAVEHDRVSAVLPARERRAGRRLGARRRADVRGPGRRRAVGLGDRFDQIGRRHPFGSIAAVVDDDAEELIVVKAEHDLLDRIVRRRRRFNRPPGRPPFEILKDRRPPVQRLREWRPSVLQDLEW